MHILRQSRFFCAVFAVFISWSCAPRAPLTPGDAFMKIRAAFGSSDYEAVYGILSSGSREKLKKTAGMVSGMNDAQLSYSAGIYGTTPERFKNISGRDLFLLYARSDRNDVRAAVKYNIYSITVSGKFASIVSENGMKLLLVQEGPYWKLDISDF